LRLEATAFNSVLWSPFTAVSGPLSVVRGPLLTACCSWRVAGCTLLVAGCPLSSSVYLYETSSNRQSEPQNSRISNRRISKGFSFDIRHSLFDIRYSLLKFPLRSNWPPQRPAARLSTVYCILSSFFSCHLSLLMMLLHHLHEPVKQIRGIVRTWRGFRMILN